MPAFSLLRSRADNDSASSEMRRDPPRRERRRESEETSSSSAELSDFASRPRGPARLISLLAELLERHSGGRDAFSHRGETQQRLKNAAWERLLLPALRHRLPAPQSSASFSPSLPSSFASSARSRVLELCHQWRWHGREDDSRALLLLCEVVLSRTSSALPSFSLLSSADASFDARKLKNSGALVYLLLLLSSLSDARDSRDASEEHSTNAEDLCRASEFSRHVLTAAGVHTPQLDARRLRLSFAGTRASSQASSSPSLSRGISLKLREEIRAAARRLGLLGSAPRSDASCSAQEVEAGDKTRGAEADGEGEKSERDRGTANEAAGRADCVSEQELPWKSTVESASPEESASHEEDPLGAKEESATDSLHSRVSYASQSQETGLSQHGASSLGAPLCPDPQWPRDLPLSASSVSPVSSVSSLRAVFAPVSPPEFSFRRVAALPLGASASRRRLETSVGKPFSAPLRQLSLCDSGKRPELSSRIPERSGEAETGGDALSWGGAWRGCFDRRSLAPSLLPPLSEGECLFRLVAEGESLSGLQRNPAPSSSRSLLSPRPVSSSASSSASSAFSDSPSSSAPAFPGLSAAAPGRGDLCGDAFPSAFAREPPRFFPLPQSLLPGGPAPTNRRRDNGVSFFAAFALEEEDIEAPWLRDRKRELQGDRDERGERGDSSSSGSQGARNQEEAAGNGGTVVQPGVLCWKRETEAVSLERERKTPPARDGGGAPRAALAMPETWEKEMIRWLQSQETGRLHGSSAVVDDRGFLEIRRFASWDMRLLQPRIQRVAESLRAANAGDAGAPADAWTAQMLRCMDSRTTECMSTFLATAYGAMTVGGLDNRFALLSGKRLSVRGKDPPVRPAASLVSSSSSSSSSASSSVALCRLSLSSVLSTSPLPLTPFAARAPPPGVRTPRATFPTAPLWLQCCVLALQGCESLLFRTTHSHACPLSAFGLSDASCRGNGASSSSPLPSLGCASTLQCRAATPLIDKKARREAEISFSCIRLPPLSRLVSDGEAGREASDETATETAQQEGFAFSAHVEEENIPFFAACCDLRYASCSREKAGGETTEREVRDWRPWAVCTTQQGRLREAQMAALGSMDVLSKIADPAWTPVFEEIAELASLLRRLRAFVAFFASPRSLSPGEGQAQCFASSPQTEKSEGKSRVDAFASSSPLSSAVPRGFGLTVGAFVTAVETVLSDFDAFLLSGEVYAHLSPGASSSAACATYRASSLGELSSSCTAFSFVSSPLGLLPRLREWKTRIVFLARICRLDFPREASSRERHRPRERFENLSREERNTGTASLGSQLTEKSQQRRDASTRSRLLQRCTDTWWSFPRGSSLLDRIFFFASSVQSEAVYTPQPRGFLSLESLLFSNSQLRTNGRFCRGTEKSGSSSLCWTLAVHLLLHCMSPLLNFLENWVFKANMSDPADEFLRASPGALSTVSSPALECMSSRIFRSSGPGDFCGGALPPRDGEVSCACVSSLFSEEPAQPRWADTAARVVGEASQATFVLPSFLLSVQQEIHNSGLLLLILLHASPEAFRAASLASAASLPSAASSRPSAFSSFLAGALAPASRSAAGAIVRGALQKGDANARTCELAVSAPSLTLEALSRSLDARRGSSPSFFSSPPFAFTSLLSAPSPYSWLPSFVHEEKDRQLPTSLRTTRAGVLEFSVFLRDLLRVERKFRDLHARGLARVARLVEDRQVQVHLADLASEEARRLDRAALHQRIRLSHQTQLLQLQRARVSREMVLVAAALASQKTSCPSLAEVWNEVLRKQREEQKQLLDEQRQAQAAAQRDREKEEEEDCGRRKDSHSSAREERVQAELERQLRDQRREYEQLEEQVKRLQQLHRDLRMSLSSLPQAGEGLKAQNTQWLVGRRAAKTHLESRKLSAGLAHAEHAVQTAAAALASVEQTLERRRERKRSRGDAGDTREEGEASQPSGGRCVVGDLLKDPEIEVKENERGTRLPSSPSVTSSPRPASSSAALPSASSSREAARNDEPLGNCQRRNSDAAAEPETLMTRPGVSPRHPKSSPAPMSTPQEARTTEEERAEEENSDFTRDETREDHKTETRCRPAVSEANQGTTSAWTTTAASSPRAGDSVSSNEEIPQESSQERVQDEELEEGRYEDAGRGLREAGHWQTEMERRGEQGNLNRSIWICIGQAVATQHAIANRAFLAFMGRQHCDILGALDTVKKFILFGASDSMGQFAVALIAELQKKEKEKLQGAFSAAAAAGGSASDPGWRQSRHAYTGHLGSSLAIHVPRYTERINALFASALGPIRSSASGRCSADGGVVSGLPATPFEVSSSLHGRSRDWSGTSDAGLGFRSKMTVEFRLSEGKPAAGGADVGPDASGNREKAVRGRNVEDLLKDVEVVLHAPFPLTLFFDADTGCMYNRIFQFLTLLSFSLHCIHHVWLQLSRLHRVADARRGRGRLRPRVFLRDGEERFGFSVSPRGVESRRNSASRDGGESDGRGVHSSPIPESHVHASAGLRGESRDAKDASADSWRDDGFLLPPGLYARIWQLSVKVKFVTDALHGYVITDALQAEWTALTRYVQRTVEAALGPPRLRRPSEGISRGASPQSVPPASEASNATLRQRQWNAVVLNSEERRENAPRPSKARTPAMAPGVRTPQRRRVGEASGDETPERPEVQDDVAGRTSASESRAKEADAFELFAAHRKTVSSIHTRCLLSPRLAPLHQHVMDVLRASWTLRGLQEQLERDERHLRDLLAPQRKKWSELCRRRCQMQSVVRGVSAEETSVVRASFASFDKTENGNMYQTFQREEEAILAAKRGIERAGVAAGLVAAKQLLKIENLFQTACDGLMAALQKLEPLQLLDALALRLDFNHFYSRQAALKAAGANMERRLREI
ncbi:Spc97/Spc98 family protein [Toxoplasma gondii ARI]|uniref:Spc97/Spc98 family protein n=1 Tax=Toxoplasma gondii ARI TaxID=1074872 RepID=A0A139XYJ9_TOXGO|nr:Spc97/Spc98 family protein [Toxoplasma gondii ARI]